MRNIQHRRHMEGAARAPRGGFTLIEILVVVAIIGLLIAILLPALATARESARMSLCGHNIKELTKAGTMWLSSLKHKDQAPVNRGWAPYVMQQMSGQAELFECPSNSKPLPIPAVIVTQVGRGRLADGKDLWYPSASIDGAYFRRHPEPQNSVYVSDMETDVTRRPDIGDTSDDFNDAYVYCKPDAPGSRQGEVWLTVSSTGRELALLNWREGTLEAFLRTGNTTDHYRQPVLWGGYGMNLSAGLKETTNRTLVYIDYTDWSAVVERKLEVKGLNGSYRVDDPAKMVAWRHGARVNVGFMDTHIERLSFEDLQVPADQNAPSVWHPARRAGWTPIFY